MPCHAQIDAANQLLPSAAATPPGTCPLSPPGPATSHQSVLEIRDAIREERPCSVCLLNYRKVGGWVGERVR